MTYHNAIHIVNTRTQRPAGDIPGINSSSQRPGQELALFTPAGCTEGTHVGIKTQAKRFIGSWEGVVSAEIAVGFVGGVEDRSESMLVVAGVVEDDVDTHRSVSIYWNSETRRSWPDGTVGCFLFVVINSGTHRADGKVLMYESS